MIGACALLTIFWGCPQVQQNNTSQNPNNLPSDSSSDLPEDLGPKEQRSCSTEVTFNAPQSAGSVSIAGEFNQWDEAANPLALTNGQWGTSLVLEPGEYAYKFVVDGAYEGAPPIDVPTKWADGFENRSLNVLDCARPTWKILSSDVTPQGQVRVQLKFVSGRDGASVDPQNIKVTVGDVAVSPTVDPMTGAVSVMHQAPSYGKVTVKVWGQDTQGQTPEVEPLWLPLWHEAQQFDWQDAVMYLIFTDRFLDSDGTSPVEPIPNVKPIAGYMGGDFKGIIDKIDEGYFEQMGVNLLWLSPIYENTEKAWVGGDGVSMFTGYHGYWPTDSLNAETRYGDAQADANARLKELIDKAHARGIRVLFDVVHNHVHEEHNWCKDSPEWCAITCTCGSDGCSWDDKPLTCQFAPYLPDLSYQNHAILQRQVHDTMELARKFDIDGFRVDAAKHMDHVIMRRLRQELNAMEARSGIAPFYTVGETYTFTDGHGLIMQYVGDHELHGQFDFPLLYPIRDVFGKSASFRTLDAAVATSAREYGDAYRWMSPFLGNHDIPRFVTEAVGNSEGPWGNTPDIMGQGGADAIDDGQWNIINRLSMAFAFLLTQPGVPLIYYGDEVGLAGAGDPDNRRMMDWTWNAGQQELMGRVRALGRIRQDLKPLRRGKMTQLWVDDDLYVYARHSAPDEVVLVAMNKGSSMRQEVVTIPNTLSLANTIFQSVNSEREVVVNSTGAQITLNPWEYAIFKIKQ